MSSENQNPITGINKEAPESEGWYALKIAFSANEEEALWNAPASTWLEGWSLSETDATGARLVVIFELEHLPTADETKKMASLIKEIEADFNAREGS